MKQNGRLYAPQFGAVKPIEKPASVADTRKSTPEARRQDSGQEKQESQEKPSFFWYPRDLDMPTTPEAMLHQQEKRAPAARKVPVTVRKRRHFERKEEKNADM